MNALLETRSLTRRFGGLVAVDHLDISVESREIVGLIGPNGSGKTTLFNLITGFLAPHDGEVFFRNDLITARSPATVAQRGLGRTFQQSRPFGKLTVFENMLVPRTAGVSLEVKEERARSILNDLDLDHVADQKGQNLSGGQKKLLEIARVLMLDPDLILFDEPSAGVNPALMETILDHLRELNRQGRTIFIIEHSMWVIEDLCERVIVMNNGQKVTSGSFEEVRSDQRVRDAYLGGSI